VILHTTHTGLTIGSIGWVPDEHDGAFISPAYVVFSIDENIILPELFWFILKSEFFNKTLRAATAGSVRMNLTYPLLETLKVPLPPIPIQQKIVEYWKGEILNAGKCIEQSNEINNIIPNYLVSVISLKPLKQAHSRQAFVSSWKEIERWGVNLAREMTCRPNLSKSPFPIVSLSEVITDLQNGWSPKCLGRKVEDDEWGVLKVGAVSFGWFDESQNKALPSNLKPREHYEVKPGDLIISRANITQYVGASALVGKVRPKLMLCDKLFRVIWKQDSTILPEYLNEILKIPHLRWQIENNLTGASPTMKNISKPALMALQFPLPPLDIQEEIISEIEEKRKEASALQNDAKVSQKQAEVEIERMILGTLSVEDL
jgi:type I restriction enzyme S subunit